MDIFRPTGRLAVERRCCWRLFICWLVLICIASKEVTAQTVTTNLTAQADVDIRSLGASANLGYNRTVLKIASQNADPSVGEDSKAYIRFQLPIDFGTATSATFTLTRVTLGSAAWTYNVYGLKAGSLSPSPWTELSWPELDGGNQNNATTWNNAPGNVTTNASTFTNADLLGSFTTKTSGNGGAIGDQFQVSGATLVNFLNSDSNGYVTLLVSRSGISTSVDLWASKENTTNSGPTLSITHSPNADYTNLASAASRAWRNWRLSRTNFFTAGWQGLYLYSGTPAEYSVYAASGLNSVPCPFSDYTNATGAGLGTVLGGWEGLPANKLLMAQYIAYPAPDSATVNGYMLDQEPYATNFPNIAVATAQSYRYDQRNAIPMVVQLPNWAVNYNRFGLGSADGGYYNTYINKYVRDVKPCVMINDNYPIYGDGTDSTNFYPNIEYFRSIALSNNIGLIGFALTTSHTNGTLIYRQPAEADLNWMVYSYLAYGADGMFYYNYRYPHSTNYGEGLVTDSGDTPRATYYIVQQTGRELDTLWPVFKHLKSTGVFHTGANIPIGTTAFSPALSSCLNSFSGNNFLIGEFTNADDSTDTDIRVLLVNKSHGLGLASSNLYAEATFTCRSNFPYVAGVDPSTGVQLDLASSNGYYSINLPGGKGWLLKFSSLPPKDSWVRSFGLSGAAAGMNSDPDGDGTPNILEYAFDGNPTNSALRGLHSSYRMTAEQGTPVFEYVYPRRVDPGSGLGYQLQSCTDLLNWSNANSWIIGRAPIDNHYEYVTNHLSAGTNSSLFLRLRITYQ